MKLKEHFQKGYDLGYKKSEHQFDVTLAGRLAVNAGNQGNIDLEKRLFAAGIKTEEQVLNSQVPQNIIELFGYVIGRVRGRNYYKGLLV